MLVWLASIRPETRWLLWTYGLLRDNATWMLVGPHGMNCANFLSRIRCNDLCTCVGSTSPWNMTKNSLLSLLHNQITWNGYELTAKLPEWYLKLIYSSDGSFYLNQLIPSYSLAAAIASLHLKQLFCAHSLFAVIKNVNFNVKILFEK